MMRLPEPPEGVLDPKIPWYSAKVGERTWKLLKARLTGRKMDDGTQYSSFVNLTEADANRLIENLKKDPRGYPQFNNTGGAKEYENLQKYQEWLVEEYLEKPFREQVDQKIEDRQAVQRIADVLNKKKVQQAVELTTDVIEDPWDGGTVPPKQYAVVPTTKLLPAAKEPTKEQPKEVKKRGSSLVKSMTKTMARMENHFQKLTELSEVSEGNVSGIEEAFRIQSDLLVKGFQDTTSLVNKVASAVNLQADTMVRVAKGKRDLDQKRLDTQEALNKEMQMEQQSSSSGTSKVTGFDKKNPPSGGISGSIGKIFGSAVIAKLAAGKGLKLAQGGGKAAKMVTMNALERTMGKGAVDFVAQKIGRKAAEEGLEHGFAKSISKKIPLLGLGLSGFFAIDRASKGDMLGAALEIASGAASTIPGAGTAGSLAIDAALIARDSGTVPFAEGGLTQRSTLSNNRPGVTDLSPDLFKKMYQYELDYESRNKVKFGRLYADGYQKYFDSNNLVGKLTGFLNNFIEFFASVVSAFRNVIRNNPFARTLRALQGGGYEYQDPDTKIKITVTSRRGMRTHPVTGQQKFHGGTDIAAESGTPLRAISDGEIVDSDSLGSSGWGNFLVFKDDSGIYHLYGHMQDGYKRGGQVKKGDIIGKVGNTGMTTGPHLHWEAGTGWTGNGPGTGGVITGGFDPLDKYTAQQPFFTKREEPKQKPKPTISPTADRRQTDASQKISQNFGVPVDTRVPFPYKGEDNFYHAYKTTTGWDIYAGRARLDTSNGKNADVVKAFLDYAESNLVRNANGTSPELTGTDFQRQEPGSNARERGGPVSANTPYLVGEKGPELFVPKENGTIVPNNQVAGLFGMFGGGSRGGFNPADSPYAKELELERIKKQLVPGKGFTGKYDQFGNPTGYGANAGQTEKLIAMAPLEDQMSNSVMIIRVNNTAPPVIMPPSDDGIDQPPTTNLFSQLHLAAIS